MAYGTIKKQIESGSHCREWQVFLYPLSHRLT
jgi:hypothetical protein